MSPTPQTKAGQLMLAQLERLDAARPEIARDAPIAWAPPLWCIEDEAVAAERARIRAAVEAAWTTHGAISQAVVLRCVDGADR